MLDQSYFSQSAVPHQHVEVIELSACFNQPAWLRAAALTFSSFLFLFQSLLQSGPLGLVLIEPVPRIKLSFTMFIHAVGTSAGSHKSINA